MHSTSVGSGSHFPFPIHTVVLEPLSMCVEGQVSVALAPIIAGWLEPRTSMTSSFNKSSSEPQLTMNIKY